MIVNNPIIRPKTNPMRRNSTPAMGAFHPILFFMFIYGISLLLAIFVCRTVYYSLNEEANASQTVGVNYTASNNTATALR
jgi:hypothetical protein